MKEQERTDEARVLDRYPDLRKTVVESPEFAAWLGGLKMLEVDGETLYLRGGDMLRDEDQVIFEWAYRNGLVSDTAIQRALLAEDESAKDEDKEEGDASKTTRKPHSQGVSDQ